MASRWPAANGYWRSITGRAPAANAAASCRKRSTRCSARCTIASRPHIASTNASWCPSAPPTSFDSSPREGNAMALDPNKFTRKTEEAIGAAQAAGREAGHTEIAPEHILRALLDQPEGVVNGVLERIGVDLSAVRVRVDEALSRRPQVSGATVRDATLAQATFQILEAA